MLGMPKTTTVNEQFYEIDRRWDAYPGELAWVDDPACRQVVLERDFNLLELLPLCKINEHDGGFYLSKASVVSNDPDHPGDLDTENVGIYRLQVLDRDTLAMQALPFHDIAVHIRKAEKRGESRPVAVCLGVDPDGSGAWEIYRCTRCNYGWRSSEPQDVTDPAKRDPFFQLDKTDLATLLSPLPLP